MAVGLLHVEHVMGTAVTIDVRDRDLAADVLERALVAAVEVLHRADATFSTWRADSALMQGRRGVLVAAAAADLAEVERACRVAVRRTQGWFDPWALPGDYDPTGLVKGWAAQRACAALTAHGIGHALVNAGGDLCVVGDAGEPGQGWAVGISAPQRDAVLATVHVTGGAVATSGGYERGSLAIDPRTGAGVERLASATVLGLDLAQADACATAATAHGPDALAWLEADPDLEALLVTLDGRLLTTTGWP